MKEVPGCKLVLAVDGKPNQELHSKAYFSSINENLLVDSAVIAKGASGCNTFYQMYGSQWGSLAGAYSF